MRAEEQSRVLTKCSENAGSCPRLCYNKSGRDYKSGTFNTSILLVGVPLFLALVRGDIKTMFQYEDHPNLDAEKKEN